MGAERILATAPPPVQTALNRVLDAALAELQAAREPKTRTVLKEVCRVIGQTITTVRDHAAGNVPVPAPAPTPAGSAGYVLRDRVKLWGDDRVWRVALVRVEEFVHAGTGRVVMATSYGLVVDNCPSVQRRAVEKDIEKRADARG